MKCPILEDAFAALVALEAEKSVHAKLEVGFSPLAELDHEY
jgi:hypothetical protein